jgi:hypothetical protein
MIDRSDSFDHIEKYIDTLGLPEEQLRAPEAAGVARGDRPTLPPAGR